MLTTVVGLVFTYFKGQLEEQRREKKEAVAKAEAERDKLAAHDALIDDSLRYLMKDRILQACQHWDGKGFCPMYNREALTDMVNVYHDLGGNSFIQTVYEDTMGLPASADEQTVVKRSDWGGNG